MKHTKKIAGMPILISIICGQFIQLFLRQLADNIQTNHPIIFCFAGGMLIVTAVFAGQAIATRYSE